MNTFNLLRELRANGVKIFLERENIRIGAAKGKISQQQLELLKQNKSELISLLKEEQRLLAEQKNIQTLTVSDFPLATVTSSQLSAWQEKYEIEDIYAATSMQAGMIFHSLKDKGASLYVNQLWCRLDKSIDLDDMKLAWEFLLQQHSIFRTAFVGQESQLQQLVCKSSDIPWSNYDHTHLSEAEHELQFQQFLENDQLVEFDFEHPPLLRVATFNLADGSHRMVWTYHHALVDGWCSNLVLQGLIENYKTIQQGKSPRKVALESDYKRYIHWLSKQDHKETASYWRNKLQPLNHLVLLADQDQGGAPRFNACKINLSERLTEQLNQCCRNQSITLNSLVMGAWALLVHKESNSNIISFGATVAGRPATLRNVEKTIGLFINSIPVVSQFTGEGSLVDWCKSIQDYLVQSNEHSYYPLTEIQKQAPINGKLFESLVVFENYLVEKNDSDETPFVQDVGHKNQTSQPLALVVLPAVSLGFHLGYQQQLFSDKKAKHLLDELQSILEVFAHSEPKASISQMLNSLGVVNRETVTVLEGRDREEVLHRWNDTQLDYPKDLLLHQLFESQVSKSPDRVALTFKGSSLTYAELNDKANQAAKLLRRNYFEKYSHDMPAETLVGLYFERGFEMVVGILACLKAGATYVPISPDFPPARTQYIVDDTNTSFILSQSSLIPKLDIELSDMINGPDLIELDLVMSSADESIAPFVSDVSSCNLAYVIYTSGTTGNPKGVMIEHCNAVHLVYAQQLAFHASECQRSLLFASYTFDASVSELFIGLSNGHEVFICSDEDREADNLRKLIQNNNIDLATIPPALLQIMAEQGGLALKVLVSAGETPAKGVLETFRKNSCVINAYGPTESTVCASTHKYQCEGDDALIGLPIRNVLLYVLDEQLQPVPNGTQGELYIGGAGLARGYLNRAELTAERFIDNPFVDDAARALGYTRLYKTGDVVRRREDGNIEYLGRNDFQVKIRGYRIELGEIEAVLCEETSVRQAAVIDRARDDGSVYLVAYVVMQEGQTCDSTHLVSQLGATLPEYMIPSHIVTLSTLPLTLNGKLDRRALPAPEIDSEEFVAPRNETEQALCQVWQDVLGLAQVGIEDNFFRLGGDSIVCIQLVSRLRQAGYVCQVKDIFNAPTVAQLSCLLADNMLNGVAQVEAEQGELVGTFDLLPIQQWFFDKALPAPHHWNQAFMVRLPSTVSPQALQAGLEALVARHDMLRCRFIDNKQQYYGMDEVNTELLTLDVSNLDEAQLHQQLTAFQSEFDYQFGPLWCAVHLTGYDDGSARLFMALHHLIVDAVSWRILVDDLSMIMQGHTLPDKTSSYRQWVHALKALEPDTEEIRYWQGVMATPCSLPTAEETIMVDVLQQSSEVTAHLLRDTNEGFNTEINDVLLSAMVLALSETLGEQAYTLGLEGHGREPMDETLDLSRTIGWFTTLYPVRLLGQETVADTLIATKETLRQVPNKGLGFGALRNKGELGGALPAIMFNYLGQFGDGSGQVEDWSLVGEDVGMTNAAGNEDSALLSVTGAIYEGRLRFKVVSRLSELVHHNFNEAFTSALAAVVAAGCAQAKLGGRKTPSDYGVPTLSAARLQYLQKTHDIEALYPASSLQQGFIYYHLNEPDDDAYRVQVLLDYHCALNIAHYRQAWQMASLRFPSLRVCFDWQDTLVQIVTSGVSLTDEHFSVVDISQLASDVQEQEIERLQQEARMIGFDLSRPGLVRLTIVKRSDTLYTVIKTEHHSISDGWSGPVLGQAVHEYYEALQAGLTCEIKPDQAYLNAQAYQMSRQAQSEAFWQAQKQQYGEANDLRGLFDSSVELADSHLNTAPKEQALELTGNALAQLKNMCRESGTTVNVALQFAWHYLLHGYTQDNQTLVGTTVSGRDLPIEGIESSVGLYINTLPLSVSWDEQQSVEGVLQSIQQSIAMLNSHSAISLAKLQEGGHRLFHSLVVFENYPRTALEGAEGIINQVHFRKSVEKMDYPLTLRAFERDESLVMALCYNGDWLSNKQATRLLSQVMRILTQLPQVERLSQLCLLDEQERTATLLEGNDTQATYPIHGTLVSEFERQVLASPEHIALEMGGVQLSYQQLDAQANQLARELRDRYQQRHRQAMPANTLIGLYMDRSVEMMVAVLAVLKAGGAYVPISPEFPAERTAFILKDTGCPFVLTHAAGAEALQGGLAEQECAAEWLAVEQVMKHTVASDTALPLKAGPEDLAYVIYTSGTTGQPKGVMIAHRAIVNRINWMQKRYPLSSEDKVLQKTPYIFDVSVWELFWAHWAGASLVMAAPDVHRQPEALHTLIEEAGVTTLHFVPSMLAAFCAEMSSEGKVLPRSVKQVFSSGEALQVSHVDAFYGLGQHDAVLHNLYGPTEASVDVSYFDTREAFTSHVPIGKAIDNTQLYILNKQLQPVPNGTQGELYIGGAGLARGYL
ncbi:amino acid adenylation domain-containing protein, partial [Pseudoalteromonas sp. CO342X]|uniref:non-ribosomal peptide synthetase n=1 Tax=Pseudoalteromonas sp. CO342X TaxID=1777270 RepID=UPI0010235986